MDTPVVEVTSLRKEYGPLVAVDGVSLAVGKAEIFGLVGPNGAGKTTTIECIEGLRRPDGGTARVLGLDPQADGYALRARIGVQLQDSNLPERLKVWEALDLSAAFFPHPVPWQPLLEQLGLGDKRQEEIRKLSGGQRQRLFVGIALVGDPEVVFLDELTTGLDPQARRAMWDLVSGIRDRGKTVILTTHYMEEAERLCDRVGVIDQGRLVALDSPGNLVRSLGVEMRVVFTADQGLDLAFLDRLPGVQKVERSGEWVAVSGQGERLVVEVVTALTDRGVRIRDLRTEQATLEDVFLALTGRAMRE